MSIMLPKQLALIFIISFLALNRSKMMRLSLKIFVSDTRHQPLAEESFLFPFFSAFFRFILHLPVLHLDSPLLEPYCEI